MSETVLSDAQMGMFRVIRPIPTFESVYQGKAGNIPIAFPGTLDPDAGKPGFAANLLAGEAVPLGSRLLVQIPMTIDMYTPVAAYAYQFIWRTRNQQWFTEAAALGRRTAAYHLPSEELGRNERSDDKRFFIPGASDVEVFEQSEPLSGAATLNVRQQRYIPQITSSWVQPLTAAGNGGIWQQGAYQFSNNVECAGPSWFPLWLDATGDELMILVYKIDAVNPWDFAGDDISFSNTYGTNNGQLPINPNVGIILASGTMGS